MKREELIEIGQMKRAHGLKGENKVKITSFYLQYLPELSVLVIEKGGEFLPFFVEELQTKSQEPIIKFESINSKEEANSLNGKKLYALANQLPEVYDDENERLVDYRVLDQNNQFIGQIAEVLEFPSQLMLRVVSDEKELMIPLHQDWIIEMDQNKNQIILELPDGFLEIYE